MYIKLTNANYLRKFIILAVLLLIAYTTDAPKIATLEINHKT